MRKALNVSSIALVFAGANLLAGCAFTGRGGIQNKTSAITQEEIEMSGLVFTDAYDVVRQFRPHWLIKRGTAKLSPRQGGGADTLLDYIAVYEDRTLMGGPDALRGIAAFYVMKIEFLDAARAQRLGSRSHMHGAIVVSTRSS